VGLLSGAEQNQSSSPLEKSRSHIAKAARLTGSPTSVTIDVYRESEPSRKLVTVPGRDIARVGDTDVYQVDLLGCSVNAVFERAENARAPRAYTLIWRDDAGNQIVTTERLEPDEAPGSPRSLMPAAFKLFVTGKGLKSEAQLARVRRQLTEKLGREPLIELIDILDDPTSALAEQVIATPALVQVTGWTGRSGRP
jgi:hypothetical protein